MSDSVNKLHACSILYNDKSMNKNKKELYEVLNCDHILNPNKNKNIKIDNTKNVKLNLNTTLGREWFKIICHIGWQATNNN